jgi:hypothetical protein
MWVISGILVVGALFALIEVPPLRRKKLKRELAAFFSLLLFGIGLSIAEALQLDIPNPLDWIQFVFKPLSELLMGMLK